MTELAVVVTGVLGVAGILGSLVAVWITGKVQTANLRLSISSENERTRTAEKRRIYARAIAIFAASPLIMLISLDKEGGFEEEFKEMMTAAAEVELIASQIVAEPVEKVMDELLALLHSLRRIIEESELKDAGDIANLDLRIEQHLMAAQPQFGAKVGELTDAMRADLGEEILKDDKEEPVVRNVEKRTAEPGRKWRLSVNGKLVGAHRGHITARGAEALRTA